MDWFFSEKNYKMNEGCFWSIEDFLSIVFVDWSDNIGYM